MTNDCPTPQQLSAFHDGELPSDVRAAIAGHLEFCDPCIGQLQSLRQMSGLFSAVAVDRLSQISWHRLHAKVDAMLERGLVRWAWEVSGIAAAILIAASVCLGQLSEPSSATAAVPPWVGAQASADPVLNDTPTPAAVWYLADAKSSSEAAP